MTKQEPCPRGLLQRGLLVVLLGYALAIQLFVGAYFQQSMVAQALSGQFVICASHLDAGAGEQPVDQESKAQCLALCQLACGSTPALTTFLRDLPPHQPASLVIRWEGAYVPPTVAVLLHTPQARGPPALSMIA